MMITRFILQDFTAPQSSLNEPTLELELQSPEVFIELERQAPQEAISIHELESIKQKAFESGFAAGAEPSSSSCIDVKELESIAAALEQHCKIAHQACEQIVSTAVPIIYSIAKKVAANVLDYLPEKVLLDFLSLKLPALQNKTALVLEVPADCSNRTIAEIRKISGELNISIEIKKTSEVLQGDCRISWDRGNITKNTTLLFQELDEMLAKHFARLSDINSDYSIEYE